MQIAALVLADPAQVNSSEIADWLAAHPSATIQRFSVDQGIAYILYT